MTDSFSTWLRKERERQNISIAAIAASTKIKASLFESLERGDVSQWPSGIFRRSFIRAYAAAIKLDPDTVCRQFAEQYPEAGDVGRPAPDAAVKAEPLPPPAPPSQDDPQAGFRLTLAEASGPFRGGAVFIQRERRLMAMAWDAGILLALAIVGFVAFGTFWKALALAAMAYYLGSIFLLGNSPGVYVFAPRLADDAAASRAPQAPAAAERTEVLPFEPSMLSIDAMSADQLTPSPGPRLHRYPALRDRIEIDRPQARA